MPLAAARALSGVAASTSGGWNTGSESFLVAGRRAARRRPHCPPAASFAAAVAVSVSDARPLPPRRRRSSLLIVSASASSSSQPPPPQLFGPPPFDPAKLTVTRLSGAEKESNSRRGRGGGNGSSAPATAAAAAGTSAAAATSKSPSPLFPLPRRYTLTHNDVTGALALSIGSEYNSAQLEGWYVRMIRDEVLAEWRREDEDKGNGGEAVGVERADGGDGSSSGSSSSSSSPSSSSASDHSLHIFCHVSGDARWLAPPRLRSRIFQREMALVLDTIAHADAELMRSHPGLGSARVVVHLRSHVRSLDARLVWGMLGDRGGWREPPRLLEGLLEGVVSDLWRELGGGTELRADSAAFFDADGSDFDGVGLSSSSSASSADFYYDGASASRAALNDEEMSALMSGDDFIAMAERDTVDDDDEEEEEEGEEGAGTPPSRKGSALRI